MKLRITLLHCFLLVVFITILFQNSAKIALQYSGDSFQYLKMANDVVNFKLPLTDKWMPLYSVLIGIVSLIGSIELIDAVHFVNLFLYIGVVLLLYFTLIKSKVNKSISFFATLLFFALNRELYYNSLTIMAELPFLFFVIWFLFATANIFDKRTYLITKDVVLLSCIVLLAVFTKYTGLLLLLLLVFMVLVWSLKGKRILNIIITVALVFPPYLIWSRIKADKDLVGKGLVSKGFFENILININDLFISFVDFFSIPKITNIFIQNDILLRVSSFLLLIVGVFLFVWHLVKHLKTKPYESILLLFIFGYIGAFLYLTSATGINEVNQRTLFYPLFVVLLFLIYKVVKSEVVMLRTGLFVVLLTIGFFNFLKLNQTYKRFVTTGYGELASSFLKAKNQTFENAIKLIKEKNIKSENIYTNRHKLLPIYLNFVLLKELPTNRQWLGNKHWYLSDKEIELKLSEIKLSMQENNSIIIFVGSDSDKVFQNYYTDLSKYFALLQYEDGFIIY